MAGHAERPLEYYFGATGGGLFKTTDGGDTWTDATPPDMPPHTRVITVEVSPHSPAGAHVAGIRYEMDDRRPYVWQTDDYGATWTPIKRRHP